MDTFSNDIKIREDIFTVNGSGFESLALSVFNFQYNNNDVYRKYCQAINTTAPNSLDKIPFLPISFFKTKQICSGHFEPVLIFESSGTTGTVNSKHFVKDHRLYEISFMETFNMFYNDPRKFCIIGLLPSYLERKNSSLVYMVNDLIKKSGHAKSGFYLYETDKLYNTLLENEQRKQPTLLIGVTYALLDFAEKYKMDLQHTIVMETGGMKGRRKELTREEVHDRLKQQLGLAEIHSEYGMTELLSQAYSKRNGIFNCPPWMKIVLRSEDDPFEITLASQVRGTFATGIINIIDLANLYSCSFIATDDIGKLYKDGSFEIPGRIDNSDIRGCGLMVV